MTEVNAGIDLKGLTRQNATLPQPKRSPLRWVVPFVLLLGLGVTLWMTLGDTLARKTRVQILRPEPSARVGSAPSGGAALYQAAGWIEPDPFPIAVPALVAGSVKSVLALESASVREGDVVVQLVDDEARLALAEAEAKAGVAEAEAAKDLAVLHVAEERYAAALDTKERLSTATAEAKARSSNVTEKKAAVERMQAAIGLAESELALARQLASVGADGPRQVEIAEAKLREARAAVSEAKAALEAATHELAKSEAALVRATSDSTLRFEDKKMLEEARGEWKGHEAAAVEARAARDRARLALERTQVRAPASGVVLTRLVTMGSSLPEPGAPVMTLYDPAHLRVRVDVAQGDVRKASVGQVAEVLADVRPGRPYKGEVVRIVHQADIAKVTLQVHVRILDGDALLRPEMLTQVRFRAPPTTGGPSSQKSDFGDAVSIPASCVRDGQVWVIDGVTQRARRQRVTALPAVGDKVVVTEGLDVSSKVIVSAEGGLDRLEDGTRVTMEGR